MTNLGLETYLKSLNVNLKRVNVGDRYILDEMINNGYNLGGEPSGHVIISDHAKSGDGLLTAIKILSLLKKSGLKASEFLRPFKIIPYKVENVSGLKEDLLQNRNVSNQLVKYEHELRKDHNGRLLVRQSGTEPIVRILVECDKKTVIDNFISKISNFLVSKNKNL